MIQAEPGVDGLALADLQRAGTPVAHWDRSNLFFGGCQAVGRESGSGELAGAGDPRRGGSALVV